MADDFTPRERAAAEAMIKGWPLNGANTTDILRLARVALRAADGVKKPIAKCEWDVRSGWCAKCGHGIGAGCV